jgi:hypothetical protein
MTNPFYPQWQPDFNHLKPIMIGEFFEAVEMLDEDGEFFTQKVFIKWTTTKDILKMAADNSPPNDPMPESVKKLMRIAKAVLFQDSAKELEQQCWEMVLEAETEMSTYPDKYDKAINKWRRIIKQRSIAVRQKIEAIEQLTPDERKTIEEFEL